MNIRDSWKRYSSSNRSQRNITPRHYKQSINYKVQRFNYRRKQPPLVPHHRTKLPHKHFVYFDPSLKGPLILPPHLLLFLRCKIIFDIESFANLLWSLALYHVSHSLTSKIQETLDVQIVCCLKIKYTQIMSNHCKFFFLLVYQSRYDI